MTRWLLFEMLLRREFGRVWALGAGAFAAIGFLAAWSAAGLDPQDTTLGASMVRRADVALFSFVLLLACLKTAERLVSDQKTGWLVPLRAAGASGAIYAGLLIFAVSASLVGWLAAGGISFAAGAWLFAGTTVVLQRLPVFVATALPCILCASAFTALVALPLRDALAASLTVIILTAIPYIILLTVVLRASADVPPRWLEWLLRSYPPRIAPAGSIAAGTDQLVYLVICMALAAALSVRLAGRRT